MASQRHILRAIVMQTIFAWEFRGGDPEKVLNYNLVNGAFGILDRSYASELLQKILLHREHIKEQVKKFAPEWPWEKIAPVDRAILEVGSCELLYSEDIPQLVAINEAIELAKEFGNESSSKFVNGVLSSLYNESKNKKLV